MMPAKKATAIPNVLSQPAGIASRYFSTGTWSTEALSRGAWFKNGGWLRAKHSETRIKGILARCLSPFLNLTCGMPHLHRQVGPRCFGCGTATARLCSHRRRRDGCPQAAVTGAARIRKSACRKPFAYALRCSSTRRLELSNFRVGKRARKTG